MACVTGTNIVNDSLVFHFDLENGVKSFKGAPTTNLAETNILLWDDVEVSVSSVNEAFQITTTSSASARVDFNFTTAASTTYTFAVDVKTANTKYVGLSFSSYGNWTGSSGGHVFFDLELGTKVGSLGSGPVDYDIISLGNGWYRIWTAATSSGSVGTAANLILYETVDPQDVTTITFAAGNKIYAKNPQIETNNFLTKFVNGSRTNTESIVDVSPSRNVITVSDLTYRKNNTPTFDGVNDYLDIPDDLGYTTEVSAFSWFKSNGEPSGSFHIILGGQELEISIHTTGYLRVGVIQGSRRVHDHGSGLTDGNWHQVGFTFDGTDKIAYIDGSSVGSVPIPAGTLTNSVANRRIGRFGSSGDYYANGEISQVKIYNKALTEAEVKQNFEASRSRYGI